MRACVASGNLKTDDATTRLEGLMSHKKPHKPHEKPDDPNQPADLFAEDLARDSSGKQSSSMEELVQDLADPEPHRQHSRKGQAESPREATPNQPEHKKRKH